MTKTEYAYWLADKIPSSVDYGNEASAVLRRQADEIERVSAALEEIGTWDCKGDALRDAYDFVYGKGKWDVLLGKTPNSGLDRNLYLGNRQNSVYSSSHIRSANIERRNFPVRV